MSARNRRKKQKPRPRPKRHRFFRHCVLSLLLILAVLYIQENEPEAAAWARKQLHTSTDFAAAWEQLSPLGK